MNLKRIFQFGTSLFMVVCFRLLCVLTNSLDSADQSPLDIDASEHSESSYESTYKIQYHNFPKVVDVDIGHHDIHQRNQKSAVDSKATETSQPKVCSASFGIEGVTKSDLNMLDIYENIKFQNLYGGVWRQGWNIEVNRSRFSKQNKLKVFVVPHSHNDPGWIKTFEEYYKQQTKHILNSMLETLDKDEHMKFIWAEMSFFKQWWNDISGKDRMKIRRLTNNGQLEFVTGGWVMPDESSAHYYSILTQLIEGHQWLYHHLGYIPKNGWAIDPFGLSPTVAYFLRRTGLSNMAIQRAHYEVKKYLASLQELEFKWRQPWDFDEQTDMLCHVMPFQGYSIQNTCGPNPSVCSQFDFKQNVPIVARYYVKSKSLTLLNQYRAKAMLYKTNVLLVPLGDDFRWETKSEWTAQITNYRKIFDYINSQSDLYAELKFGTLDDYFQALVNEINETRFSPSVLTGDFFTYADKDDNYWSGYYTSRPFHKAMDRELMANLRSAQIMFSIMCAEVSRTFSNALKFPFIRHSLGYLITARRHLSLFQHHDGVSGTSKDDVMIDYAKKLFDGLRKTDHVMQQSLHILTNFKNPEFGLENIANESRFLNSTFVKGSYDKLHHYSLLIVDKNTPYRLITIFNPTAQKRHQLVNVYVSTYLVNVLDMNNSKVEFEVFPVFEGRMKISHNSYQLSILVEMNPLMITNLKIQYSGANRVLDTPKIYMKNFYSRITSNEKFPIIPIEKNSSMSITNGYLSINFSKRGFATSVQVDKKIYPFRIGMFKYGARYGPARSGLYLFIPDGGATPINVKNPFIRIVKGKLQSYAEVWLDQVVHRVTLYNQPGLERYSMEITNVVDIRHEWNFELMMRFQTSIKSGDISYTDLNGFQMIRRKRFHKLPLQAHFYPLPTATFIEDADLRMTLLSKQPLGTASLSSGQIEVMMDRRLTQDDNRGANQGCLDNTKTLNKFRVIFEAPYCEDKDASTKPPMLSLAAQLALHSLLNPLKAFSRPLEESLAVFAGIEDYGVAPKPENLACDVQLVDMTMLPFYKNSLDDDSYVPVSQVGLLLHRIGFDSRFLNGIPISECNINESKLGHFNLVEMTGELFQPKIQQRTLSFTLEGKFLYLNMSNLLKPMEVYAFMAKFNGDETNLDLAVA